MRTRLPRTCCCRRPSGDGVWPSHERKPVGRSVDLVPGRSCVLSTAEGNGLILTGQLPALALPHPRRPIDSTRLPPDRPSPFWERGTGVREHRLLIAVGTALVPQRPLAPVPRYTPIARQWPRFRPMSKNRFHLEALLQNPGTENPVAPMPLCSILREAERPQILNTCCSRRIAQL